MVASFPPVRARLPGTLPLGPVTVTPPDTTQNPKLAGALARGVLDQPAWPLILQLGRDCLEAKVIEPRREHGDT